LLEVPELELPELDEPELLPEPDELELPGSRLDPSEPCSDCTNDCTLLVNSL
jgi:hypothetical protein